MKKLFIILTCIATLLGILLLIINFSNKKFMMFSLENEPDGIFSSSFTNDLFVITDGELTVYDENGNSKKMSTTYKLKSVFPANDIIWAIDIENNLYSIDSKSKKSTFVLSDVIDFSSGSGSYAAIIENGDLYVWGENKDYILGVGEKSNIEEPILVSNIHKLKKVYLGSTYSLLLDERGQVYECGLVDYKKSEKDSHTPIYVKEFQSIDELENIRDIVLGYGNVAIKNTDEIYYWFSGFKSNKKNPYVGDLSEISAYCERANIINYSSGLEFYLGISDNGEVYYWGWDIITKATRKEEKIAMYPTKIKQIKNAEAVYAGRNIGYVKKGKSIIVLKK